MIAMSIPREGTAKWEGPVPPFVQYALEHRERGELTPELMRELEGMDIHLSLAYITNPDFAYGLIASTFRIPL